MTDETPAMDSPAAYQPAPKVATSVAVRPILKGVVYAIARPELKLYMKPEATAKVAQQISVLLCEVIGVSGGTVERINEYELCGYFIDPADMVVGLPSIWKQFRSAVLRIENVESCTLTLAGHVGTVYVEEFAKGDRRTFQTTGETVNLTRQIGKYIPDNRIWVTQSALSYAQKKGVGNSFHQVSGQLPEAPGEQIFEWRPSTVTPVTELVKPSGTGLQWVSSAGDLVKGWAIYLGKLTLRLGIAASILFGLWNLAGQLVPKQMRVLGIPVPGDSKAADTAKTKKGPTKNIGEKKVPGQSGASGKNDGSKGSGSGWRRRKGDEEPKKDDLKKSAPSKEPTSPPPSNGPAGKKGPGADESSTTGSLTNTPKANPDQTNGSTTGIGPGADDTSTSGDAHTGASTGGGTTGSSSTTGTGAGTSGTTSAGGATNSGGTTGTNGASGTGSG